MILLTVCLGFACAYLLYCSGYWYRKYWNLRAEYEAAQSYRLLDNIH